MSLFTARACRTGFIGAGLFLALSAGPVLAQATQQQQNAIRSNCRSDYMANCSSVKPGGIEALQCLQRNVAKLSPGCQTAVNALNPPSPPPPQQATTAPAAPLAAASAPPPPAPAAQPSVAAPRPAAMPAPNAPAAPPPAAATRATASHPPQQPARAAAPPAPAAPAAAAHRQPTAQQQAAIRQSCQSDFMARCKGVQPGGAQALQCLQRNSAQLSPNCQRAVAALGGGAPAAAAPAAATAAAPPAAMPTPEQQSAIKFTCQRDFMANCRGVQPGGPDALACLQRNSARLSPNCQTSLAAIGDAGASAADGTAAPAAAAPAGPRGPVGPVRRAIRERMMNR